jgi:hypothetical protein
MMIFLTSSCHLGVAVFINQCVILWWLITV